MHPRFTHASARTAAVAVLLSAFASILAACAPPPAWNPADHLPTSWGAGVFVPEVRDVAYDPANPDVRGDLYLPTAGTPKGVIIFVHGGSFVTGDRSQLWVFNGPLARQLTRGWAIFNISYSLAPAEPFPAAVLDVAAANRWVRSNADRFGYNGSLVVLAGYSAGATIAADAALAANRTGAPFGSLPPVQGWVGIAGLYDLDHPAGNGGLARLLWGAGHPNASPLANLDAADPPGLVIAGAADFIAPQVHIQRLTARSTQVGYTKLTADVVPLHAPPECISHVPSCGASVAKMDAFFDGIAAQR